MNALAWAFFIVFILVGIALMIWVGFGWGLLTIAFPFLVALAIHQHEGRR